VVCVGPNGTQEDRVLAIIVNTQGGVEESCVFIIKKHGQMASTLQTVLPIYFDFRISVAQTKATDKEEKQAGQDSKIDFTLKLYCDQTEVTVHIDDLEILQGLLSELRRSHFIAQDVNFYAGGSSHRWVQFYTTAENVKGKETLSAPEITPEEFIQKSSNPLALYFLQPEENQPNDPLATPRLDIGSVKEAWIEKEMRAREDSFTDHQFMNAFVGTWNVNGKNATEKLDAWLNVASDVKPDIYVLCFQELDLSAEAYIVLDGSKEEEWARAISESLGSNYQKVVSKQLIGLLIVMFAATDHVQYIKEIATQSAACGLMGVIGNKGGVSIRIRYKDSYLCFVGSHLAADTSQTERRNQDYQEICRKTLFPSASAYDITKSPAGNAALAATSKMVSIFESDHTIWAGDLNYRVGLPEDQVKSLLKTNDYPALLKHDQLAAQKALLKAFSEFEEGPIDFAPTYKYDVGTNIWDSSEKRRVPSYTDRILWRSRDTSKDSVTQIYYKAHMEHLISDHKPVSALFKLKVKTVLRDKQAEVHQAIVRDLDKYENECMPDATISTSNIVFDDVRYLEPKKTSITIKNTGRFPAQYRFKPKHEDEQFAKPWIWVNPPMGLVMPGAEAKIHITVMVDNESASFLNTAREKLEDILIMHLEYGKDFFISVSGTYIRTCFGNKLEWLSRLDRPIRLWNPEDGDGDDEEDGDDASTLYDAYNALGTKSSMGSIRTSAHPPREVVGDLKQVKAMKSIDSLSKKSVSSVDLQSDKDLNVESEGRGKQQQQQQQASSTGSLLKNVRSEEKLQIKKRPSRQQSLPKDLWRIVDFIYKHGLAVDNLFLLSGDQQTMTYIRECLDTGEEFDQSRLLDAPHLTADSQSSNLKTSSAGSNSSNNGKAKGQKESKTKASNSKGADEQANKDSEDKDGTDKNASTTTTTTTTKASTTGKSLTSRDSTTDLKPQIARPVSIMNGIPPKAATFGLGENRGIHSMAEVLLRFLESLKEPVVPTEMYYRALEVANHQQAAYGLLDLMPPVNVNVFVYITSFLRELILTGGSNANAISSNGGSGGAGGTSSNKSDDNNNHNSSSSNSNNNSTSNSHHNNPNVTNSGVSDTGRSGSIYNGNDGASISGRGKRDDEDHRIAKLAAVFSSVMLRPPPGAERLSEVEALKRKTFLMQFLQEPEEEEGLGLGSRAAAPGSGSGVGASGAQSTSQQNKQGAGSTVQGGTGSMGQDSGEQ
ncbi:hypothetical protein BGZ94_003065, partial [Podila epigama]